MSAPHTIFTVVIIYLNGSTSIKSSAEAGPCMYNLKKHPTFDQRVIDTLFGKAL